MHKAYAAFKGIGCYQHIGIVFYLNDNHFPLMDGTVGDGIDIGNFDVNCCDLVDSYGNHNGDSDDWLGGKYKDGWIRNRHLIIDEA